MTKASFPVWPQDILVNPSSNGRNVDPVSAILDDRESFSHVWTVPTFTLTGGLFQKSFTIDQNYVFWFSNIAAQHIAPGGGSGVLAGNLTLTDDEQGYRFVRGAATCFGINLTPRSFRSTLPMPYPIRAGQTFTASLIVAALPSWTQGTYQIVFEGWKDYSYAAF